MNPGLLLNYREGGTYDTEEMFFDGIDSEAVKDSLPLNISLKYGQFSNILRTLEVLSMVKDDYKDLKSFFWGNSSKSNDLNQKLLSLSEDKWYIIDDARIADYSELDLVLR